MPDPGQFLEYPDVLKNGIGHLPLRLRFSRVRTVQRRDLWQCAARMVGFVHVSSKPGLAVLLTRNALCYLHTEVVGFGQAFAVINRPANITRHAQLRQLHTSDSQLFLLVK